MLKLQEAPTFTATVAVPLRDGGVAQVGCVFRWMHVRKLHGFLRDAARANDRSIGRRLVQALLRVLARIPGTSAWAMDRLSPIRSDFDYVNDILVSWSGVDLPWGPEAFERLAEQYPQVPALIVEAWVKALGENRLGN